MGKIYVPPVLPGEKGRMIESDGGVIHIRTWPDGTEEYDQGGVGLFVGPPTDALTGRTLITFLHNSEYEMRVRG